MPGCLDKCFMYWEEHSYKYLGHQDQLELAEQIERYEKGEPFELSKVSNVVRKTCLGNHLKDASSLQIKCKFHKYYPEQLSLAERIGIVAKKREKTWKVITLIVSILGLVSSGILGYLNYSKKSSEDFLQKQVSTLKQEKIQYRQQINQKEAEISKLRIQLGQKKKGEP